MNAQPTYSNDTNRDETLQRSLEMIAAGDTAQARAAAGDFPIERETVRGHLQADTALRMSQNLKSLTDESRAELQRLAQAVIDHPLSDAYAYVTLDTGRRFVYRMRLYKPESTVTGPCLSAGFN